MDGVSSLDLYLIQRHILGIAALDNVYMELAGDVDRNGRLSAKDLTLLQKAILDKPPYPELSWLFLNENIPANDLVYASNEIIPISRNNRMLYRAIKMGDVNGNVYSQTGPRSSDRVNILIEDRKLKDGEYFEIPIYIWATEKMVSFEFNIDLKMLEVLDFTQLESDDLKIAYNLGDKLLKVIGYAENVIEGKHVIGTIKAKALKSGEQKGSLPYLLQPTPP